MQMKLKKNKNIGRVLYIVEGSKTENYILRKIFTQIFDYNYNAILRNKPYKKYTSKVNANSEIFVVNAEESNIKFIDKDNDFLNNLFATLISDYNFDIDNSAMYYLFDRDSHSNNNVKFIEDLISSLTNSRNDNEDFMRQGLLLLSYPSIESFVASNFCKNSIEIKCDTGMQLKKILHDKFYNQQNITEKTLIFALNELFCAFEKIQIGNFDVDKFNEDNMKIFEWEEKSYWEEKNYRILSLLIVSLIDLGLIV